MLSSAVVAGNPTLATEYNNLRLDALALTDTVIAGEVYAATTLVTAAGVNQGYSLPTLLYESGGQWFRMDGDTAAAGARQRVAMAYDASGSIGASVRIYMPGSLVPVTGGTPSTADLGRNVSNSVTAGAAELTTRPPYYTHVGYLINTGFFMFQGPIYNNTVAKSVETPVIAGEAFAARDSLYIKLSDGRAYRALTTTAEPGWDATPLFAAQAASGAGVVVLAYTPGAYIPGFSGLTPGAVYYPGTTVGSISTTKTGFHRPLGYAISATEFMFVPGAPNENIVLEVVQAGENWSAIELLYRKKSDSYFYRADADVAESGITEIPAIAFATHAGGAASFQLVYMPGSILRVHAGFGSGDRLLPSATTGGYQGNTPASQDTFWRVEGDMGVQPQMFFFPRNMEFLPTGMQEKGYMAAGGYKEASVTQAGRYAHMGVNFKLKMVNVPSSITATSVNTLGSSLTPTASDITRFGFKFRCQTITGTGEYYWTGYYTTVGN